MIKTALTISIGQEDMPYYTYFVNQTQLGLLSSANQSIHTQTSNRPIQYLAAFRTDEEDRSSGLKNQKKQVNQWQSFIPIFLRSNIRSLNDLLVKYRIQPDLLICYDQNRLQAWLPDSVGLYLLRDGQLLRMKPVEFADLLFEETYHANHQYYSFQIEETDFFFLLPPQLPTLFQTGEISDLLLGLRQLPAKMSELMRIARLRGFETDTTWVAVEVLRKEEDQHPPLEPRERQKRKGARFSRTDRHEDSWIESASESLADADEPDDRPAGTFVEQILANPLLKRKIITAACIIAGLIIVLLIAKTFSQDPSGTDSTSSTSGTSATESTIAPAASPTPKPTVTSVPTEPQKMLVVSAQRLNLREEPTIEGTLLRTLNNGDLLVQLDEPDGDWVHVETEDGEQGYVYVHYVTEQPDR